MALKAGYKGIKKNVLDSLLTLLGSVVIKEIGDGLTLDSDGELSADINDVGDGLTLSSDGVVSADIDSDTMEFTEDGKLKAKITSGFSYEKIYDCGGTPAATETTINLISGKHFSDYDAVCINYSTIADQGIINSCVQSVLILGAIPASHKITCPGYKERYMIIDFDLEHDTFSYVTGQVGESGDYGYRPYEFYGIKF